MPSKPSVLIFSMVAAAIVAVALRASEAPVPASVEKAAPAQALPPAPGAAAVPEFANGVLVIRHFGKTAEKLGAYSNQVVPNLGELARQFVLNRLFRQVPASAGVQPDGTAFIYPLDAVLTGLDDENCYVLPVEDPAALKANLIAVLGAPAEEAGVMSFGIPQPLPLPDKLLAVEFSGKQLLVAPGLEMLRKLETFVQKQTPQSMSGDAAGDAVLTGKVDRFRRSFGKILEGSLEIGAVMAAQGDARQAEKLTSRMQGFIGTLWQLDVLEARLSIEPRENAKGEKEWTAALDLRGRPHPGTQLDKDLSGFVPAIKGVFQKILPPDTPLALQFALQGREAAAVLKSTLVDAQLNAPDSRAARMALGEFLPALLKLVESGQGDGLAALLPATGGFTGLLALELKDATGASQILETLLEKSAATLDAAIRENIDNAGGTSGNAPLLTMTSRAAAPDSTVKIWQFDSGILHELEKKNFDRTVGWPLVIAEALEGNVLLVAGGKNSPAALAAAQTAVAKPADARPALPPGTCFEMMVRPVCLVRTLLQSVDSPSSVDAGRLVAGLKDGPLLIAFRVGEGSAGVRIEIPAAVPAGLIPLWQRMANSGLRPADLLNVGGGNAIDDAGTVPAPLPPAGH